MPKISIVVSGGSSKGAYQIGFFKALQKSGLASSVEAISATSIGTINAYAFLTNKLDLAERLWLSFNVNGIWKFRNKIKNENFLHHSFSQLIHEHDSIPCDFYVTLSEISTMCAHYFNLKGEINPFKKKIIETSVSIPLLTFTPFQQKDKIYIDGGITDNIHVSPIINKKHDILFIVHFMPELPTSFSSLATDSDIVYINMSQSENFKTGNFNYRQEQVKEMIEEGEKYSLIKINEYIQNKKPHKSTKKIDFKYYYFSGARLLTVLNYFLQFNKEARILYIKKAKLTYKKLKNLFK